MTQHVTAAGDGHGGLFAVPSLVRSQLSDWGYAAGWRLV